METILSGVTSLLMEIITEGFIIVAISFAIGEIIKNSKIKILNKIPNENIPLITALIGIALSFVPEVFPEDTMFTAMGKGAISGWAATGMFEFFRNYKKKMLKTECEIEREVERELAEEENKYQQEQAQKEE